MYVRIGQGVPVILLAALCVTGFGTLVEKAGGIFALLSFKRKCVCFLGHSNCVGGPGKDLRDIDLQEPCASHSPQQCH